MIFFVNSKPMEYINNVSMSDFPCKLFICIEGNRENKVSTVKMTRFKRINTYLKDISYDVPNMRLDKDEDGYEYYLSKIIKKDITLIYKINNE
jgi:hypothetical protein